MAVDEKEVWLVRGDVRGMSRYPKEDTNIYDVRGGIGDIYHGGWFSCGWFPADMWWGEGDNT